MEFWQIALLVLFVLLPLALLSDFWPDRERLTAKGAPASREWKRQIQHEPHDDEHH